MKITTVTIKISESDYVSLVYFLGIAHGALRKEGVSSLAERCHGIFDKINSGAVYSEEEITDPTFPPLTP